MTCTLSFKDRPEEKYTIRYHDPVEAIKSLWADPSNADHLVFAPKKIFSDTSKKNRIFSEMWTGKWWHSVQVCAIVKLSISLLILFSQTSSSCNSGTRNYRYRQNTANTVLWKQSRLSCLSHYRKSPKINSKKTLKKCLHLDWLSFRRQVGSVKDDRGRTLLQSSANFPRVYGNHSRSSEECRQNWGAHEGQ